MSIVKASQSPYRDISVISTGISQLDVITGIGGIPSRRITEISGPYSVGKTTLALNIIREAQKSKLKCLWVDIEFSWDEGYAESLGVDLNKLDLIQERYAETALDEIEAALDEDLYDLVVIDSIGGLLPKQEAEKGAEGRTIGGQAGLVAKFCRKVVPLLAINDIAMVVLNHQFTDLMSGRIKTSGGMKLEYHKSLHISLRKGQKKVMKGDQQVGTVIEAKIKKNKLAGTQEQECDMHMVYGRGFSQELAIFEDAVNRGIIRKEGQLYFNGETKLGRGINASREFLEANPEILNAVKEQLAS